MLFRRKRPVHRLVVHQFEITPKAFANFSPRLERSDNLGIDHKIVIEP